MLANKVWLNQGTAEALQQQLQYDLSAYLVCPPPPLPAPPPPPAPNNYPSLTPLDATIAQLGLWEVVWGPAVFQNEGSNVADNAAYVAYCDALPITLPDGSTVTQPAFVVAMAATNPQSRLDWLTEDFYVGKAVEFEDWDPLNPQPTSPPFTPAHTPVAADVPVISMGTAIGVSKLLALEGPPTPPNGANRFGPVGGMSLYQFLKDLAGTMPQACSLVFTGHSLAGALSPTLALYLETSGLFDDSNLSPRYVYPTAGATPGNMAFHRLFSEKFPAVVDSSAPYRRWNTLLWNHLDIIPHAWQVTDLAAIPTLYGGMRARAAQKVDALVAMATANSLSSKVDYVRLRDERLEGELLYETNIEGWPITLVPIKWFLDFMIEAGYQHMGMYSGSASRRGLILPRMPDAPTANLLPGVTKLDMLEVCRGLEKWINDWIQQHPLDKPASTPA